MNELNSFLARFQLHYLFMALFAKNLSCAGGFHAPTRSKENFCPENFQAPADPLSRLSVR
jgi:hypothetical protein